jgi:eukaryotic-like serine/threonine-protein kinase
MPLTPGDKLGPYDIIEKVGAGGMGEVYRARDSRLNRDVAVKVSVEHFSERFEREAHLIAALNHPNICTLYDVGPNYLVMELVEGETLGERIQAGGLPLEEALSLARQIVAALEAAHDKGIVHRDLKPGNIKITPQGIVKVLDFGLAKVAPTAASGGMSENSPTLSMAATQAGVILGTAAYMAPEQARGLNVDKRADIWAFGVVLYEMLTGRRLFKGEDLTDTLAAVVRDKPDLSDAPAEVRRVLERCLEKDPQKRLRDISAVELLLEGGAQAPMQAEAPTAWAAWAIAGVAVIGLAALAWMHFREVPQEIRAVQFDLPAPTDTAYANAFGGFSVSPDGRYVVITARARDAGQVSLWLRPLDSIKARPLPGTEGGNFPTWSPDSRSLVFLTGGKLKRIELTGGAPLTLCDAGETSVTPTGTWNRAGVILFGGPAGLQRVSASGGGATLLTKIDPAKKESGHGYPQFLPDGERFLYFADSNDPNVRGVYASSLSHPGERQQVLRTAAKAVYVPPRGSYPGYLLWMQDQTLLAQRFDGDSLKLQGDPVSVAEDVGLNPAVPIRASYWASEAGLLVYFANPSLSKRPVIWFSREGKQLGEASPQDAFGSIALAPGGDRMAVERLDGTQGAGNTDIWLREFSRGVMTRLTFDPAADRLPIWSPDGKQVAFASSRESGTTQIFRKDASGAGQEERLTEGGNLKVPLDWSRDGKYILYREQNPGTARDLMALPLDGDRKPIPVVTTQFNESTGAISPDGRWVAYASNDSGRNELYVQAFPGASGPAGRWQISNGGAYDVRWRADGKELYYQSQDGKVMAAAIQASPQGIRAETPRELFSAPFQNGGLHEFDVTPDGQRFLLILTPRSEGSNQLTVISNWQAALRK